MEMQPETKYHIKRLVWYGFVLLGILLTWIIWTNWLHPTSTVDLPYSAFIEQVKDGNVRAVTISGSQIDGILAHPVTGPVPVTGGAQTSSDQLTFRTHFPDVVGDPNLVSLLDRYGVQITASPTHAALLSFIAQIAPAAPLAALVLVGTVLGIIASYNRDHGHRRSRLLRGLRRLNPFHHGPPFPYAIEHPTETFASIAGQAETIDALKSMSAANTLPAVLLITGQPGTGKTLLAKALAGERQGVLIVCRAAHLLGPTATPRRLHSLFQSAQQMGPGVLLIEGLDAAIRDNPDAFNQFLAELDGLDASFGLMVLGETQHSEAVDPALLRPERFNQTIILDLPDRKAREDILSLHTRGMRLASNVNLGVISRTTTGFSGAELAGLCAAAARTAQRDGRSQLTMTDFEDALDHLLIQSARGLLLNEQERRAAAYHEAGHALAAWLIPAADPVKRISIIPGAGMRSSPPLGEESLNARQVSGGENSGAAVGVLGGPGAAYRSAALYNKEDILAQLSVMLGGRAAEEIAIGDVTIRAENDLVEATRLARRMITRWGMGSMGLMAVDPPSASRTAPRSSPVESEISEETAARIDQDVQAVLSSRYAAVRRLLEESRDPLDRLVKALLVDETLDHEQISLILGPRPFSMPDEMNALFTAH